jgi:hypothetical protein
MPLVQRRSYAFRGQADSRWKLDSTLERFCARNALDPNQAETQLLDEFRKAASTLHRRLRHQSADDHRLFARHYGLPSPFLDWTRSPYVALYFAFAELDDRSADQPAHVSVFVLDVMRAMNAGVNCVDWSTLGWVSRRAREQQSVFVQARTTSARTDNVLDPCVLRLDIPSSERAAFLAKLDAMRINAVNLFRSLDSASRTAQATLLSREGGGL